MSEEASVAVAPGAPKQVETAEKKSRPKQPAKGTPERKEYNRNAAKKSREKKALHESRQRSQPTYAESVSPKEVRELLLERKLTTPNVIDTCARFGASAAGLMNVPDNPYFWTKGPGQMLEDVGFEPDDSYPSGELLTNRELFALYEYCAKRRIICGRERSYPEWLEMRQRAKTDLWFLCVDVAGKGLVEKTHREMLNFFVKKNPSLLEPGYDQESLKTALLKQDVQHDHLLLFPRSNYKSTVNVLDLVQWLLVFPDIRALVVTSTLPLGKAFVTELRSHMTVRSYARLSNLNALFPEFTIKPDEGLEAQFRCPAARLGLKEAGIWNAAADSESVGFHCDLLIEDDIVSPVNSGTPEARDKLFSRWSVIGELLDRPWGYRTSIGTRYAGGDHPDLYGRILNLNDESDEKELKILIKGAWTVLPHATHKKNLKDLVEEDVDLLFPFGPNGEPGKGSWKVLRKKLLADERTFKQQQLNIAVDDDEDNQIKLHFDEATLNSAVVPLASIPTDGDLVLSCDQAYSLNAKSDLSSVCAARLFNDVSRQRCLGILDISAEHIRGSELALKLVLWTRKYNPKIVLVEQGPTSESLRAQIQMYGSKYETSVPLYFIQPSNIKNRKLLAVKNLEYLLAQKRLKFGSGEYLNGLFQQLFRLDNATSLKSRKDDMADSIAQICTVYRLYADVDQPKPSDENDELDRMRKRAEQSAHHERIFGGDYQPKQDQPVPEPQPDPRFALANRIFGSTGIAAYRRRGQ